ncbi:MAG: mechanosensitive ion channel family protein [Deltaproteobacteria bacterium]|nr:mechanosensitive ion channel family protein [Deltaproteobacteria bacterium]
MTRILGVEVPTNPWVLLALIILAALFFAYLISSVVLWFFRKTAPRISAQLDGRLYGLIERYLFPLLIVVGLLIILDAVPLPKKALATIHRLLALSGIVLGIFLLGKATLQVLRNVESRYEGFFRIKGPIEIFTKVIFVVIGGMIILDNLGISLTPIITTLGIGSLAVAIALQDTLGNVFAGMHIKADRPIEVGHYVRLESGEEGYVDQIGWRSTRIRMLPNNMVVVPNTKLVQSLVINYYLPGKELAVLVQVGVHYDSDLEKVEKVTREVAKEVLVSVPGGVPDFDPFIRYHTFNQSSIDFTVILRAQEFVDNFLIKHEFIKRLQARYQKEGITIPFPIRTVHLKTESDGHHPEEAPGAKL